jgi:hypothetical protein
MQDDLSPQQILDFRRIAGTMVLATDEFAVPGADDPAIFDDILRSLGRDLGDVRARPKMWRDAP